MTTLDAHARQLFGTKGTFHRQTFYLWESPITELFSSLLNSLVYFVLWGIGNYHIPTPVRGQMVESHVCPMWFFLRDSQIQVGELTLTDHTQLDLYHQPFPFIRTSTYITTPLLGIDMIYLNRTQIFKS